MNALPWEKISMSSSTRVTICPMETGSFIASVAQSRPAGQKSQSGVWWECRAAWCTRHCCSVGARWSDWSGVAPSPVYLPFSSLAAVVSAWPPALCTMPLYIPLRLCCGTFHQPARTRLQQSWVSWFAQDIWSLYWEPKKPQTLPVLTNRKE